MSQFNLRNIREITDEHLAKFTNTMAKRITRFLTKDQVDKLEGKEDIYSPGQDVESAIKYHNLVGGKQFTFSKPYFPPYEPDLDKCAVWLVGWGMGNSVRDLSGFDNNSSDNWITGDPILIDGTPFNYGINGLGTKSVCLRFNRTDGDGNDHEEIFREHIGLEDNSRIRISDVGGAAICWFFRVRALATGLDQNKRRTVYLKCDNASSTGISGVHNAIRVSIDNVNKRWVVQIKHNDTFISKETNANKFLENKIYDCWITLKLSDNSIHLFLAKMNEDGTYDALPTDETLNTSGYGEEWGPDLTDPSARLFKRGPSANDGAFRGDFFDFKIFRNYLIEQKTAAGTAILLDGGNDYVNAGNDASLWSQALSKFSFSFWCYPTSISGSTRFIILHGSGAQNFQCHMDTSGRPIFRIRDSGGVTKDATTSTALTLNAWNFVACTYDNSLGSANVKLYLNTVLGGTTANLTQTINQSANMQVGGDGSLGLLGYIKEFKFWKTKPLTQSEVNLVSVGSGSPPPDYWLPMSAGSDNPLDQITGVKIGTLTNGASWENDDVGNHWRNKLTIASIDFGQVMMSDYWSTYYEGTPSYTSLSYTGGSYVTG